MMKSKNVLLVYLFVLIGGILLMLLHNQVHLFEGIVVTCGILFIVPCSYILLSWIVTLVQQKSKKRSKTSETERRLMSSAQWLLPVPIIGGITFGILLVCMPDFFVNYLIYTFGIVMILCGLAQLAFTVPGMHVLNVNGWWLLPPILVAGTGIVVLILGPDKIKTVITMLTGIVLTVYGREGFIGYIYRQSRLRATEIMNHHYPIDAAAPKAKK